MQSPNGLGHATDAWQDCQQNCHVDNTAQHCLSCLFQDSDFVGEFEDSKSSSGGSCVYSEVEHMSFSVGCAKSKHQYPTVLQNLKSFRLDAGQRMDGLPALDLWDVVIEVLRSITNTKKSTTPVPGDWRRTEIRSNKNMISHPIPLVSGNRNEVYPKCRSVD